MKTLPAAAEIARQRPHAGCAYLMQIEYAVPTAFTLRVSDEYRVALGQQWEPLVKSWGRLDEVMNTVDVGGRPAVADGIQLVNSVPIAGKARLSDLIRTPLAQSGTYEWTLARVTIYQLFDGLSAGDEVRLNVFYLADVPALTADDTLTLRMSDVAASIENAYRATEITKTLFPLADPDDVGKKIPVGFGQVPHAPALCIVGGAHTSLAQNIGPTDISILATSRDGFGNGSVIQVDDEEMLLTNTDPSGTGFLFTVVRGANETQAQPHQLGAAIWEVRSGPQAYRYVVAENAGAFKHKAVTAVYVDGVLQPQATVDLDETTLVPGKSFVVINFPALPKLARQVNLAALDTISLSTPNVTSAKRLAQNIPAQLTLGVFGGPGNEFLSALPNEPPGVTVNVTRTVRYVITNFTGGSAVTPWTIRRGGFSGTILESGSTAIATPTPTREFSWSTGSSYGNEKIGVYQGTAGGSIYVTILNYEADVESQISVTKTGGVSLSGNSTADVVIGGLVTCDLQGIQDDGAGTISGAALTLLRNPADVTKFALMNLWPHTVAGDIGTTFPISRAALLAAGYVWDFLLYRDTFSTLRRKFGEQGRSVLYLDGGQWQYRFFAFTLPAGFSLIDLGGDLTTPAGSTQLLTGGLTTSPASPPAAQLTLDYAEESLAGSWTFRRSDGNRVKNSLTGYAGRDYRRDGDFGDRYRIAINVEDLSVVPDPIHDDLELDFVQDPLTAQALSNFWLLRWMRQRWEGEGTAYWNVLNAEKFDVLNIANCPVLAHQGDLALVFNITRKTYHVGEDNAGRIALGFVEANP